VLIGPPADPRPAPTDEDLAALQLALKRASGQLPDDRHQID
jgi:hypothetical protein